MTHAHRQRVRITDRTILSRYLPAKVARQLLEAEPGLPPDRELEPHITRLHELLQTVVTYIPEYAGVTQRALPVKQAGYISRTQGTLLVADLSGFTAFSARLSTLGSEGAELVARTISDLFSALLAALAGWGGNLLKLSGDALTALFSDSDHERRAIAAALELQAQMHAFQELRTPAGVFALRVRIGLASGDILLAEVGTRERVELLVAGTTARRAMALQGRAIPGAVVADTTTYAQAPTCQALMVDSGLYQITAIDPPERPVRPAPSSWISRRDPTWELHALVARLEALRPYLVDQHLTRLAAGPPSLAGEGDLRPVTVLFACLSDAGPLLECAAPGEDDPALDRLQAAVRRIWEIVAQHGGTLNKLDLHADGHTLVALFGAPIAQGHEAERAMSCALALLRDGTVRAAEPDSADAPLRACRVGLASGQVFAGAVGATARREYTVMGAVVNLAARLMDVAAEGQVLADATTAQSARGQFRLQELPAAPIKGYDQPVPCFVVSAEPRSRLGALLRNRGPLVGREDEVTRVRDGAMRGLAGHGTIIAITGEAGIGKSRLLAEILGSLPVAGAHGWVAAIAQAQPRSRSQPYALIAEIIGQLYDLPEQHAPAAAALAGLVAERAPKHERFLPLLLAMLGLPAEESPLTLALKPEERRDRLHELVAALLVAHVHAWATVLVLEDLHWADSASVELVGTLVSRCAALPLLILCTYRPDGAPAWPEDADVMHIALQRLTPTQSLALLGTWLKGNRKTLPEDVRVAAARRGHGNPFFIEEIARTLREHGAEAYPDTTLPATIQGALLARLDRLSTEERYVLQVASVIGPLFERELLASVSPGQVSLERALERLSEAGLVRPHSVDGSRYAFAHSLTQETAYQGLLFAQRRDLHRRIADYLHTSDPERADQDPGLLAYHYRRAEAWAEALEYAWWAGQRAQALYVGDVALSHYGDALKAAERLERPAVPLATILQRTGDIHALAGRYAEAIDSYQDALAHSEDGSEQAEILICWAEVCEQQANYDEALTLLDRAEAALDAGPEHPLTLRIAARRGWVHIRRGDAEAARAAVEPCMAPLEAQEQWSDLLLGYKVFFQIALDQGRWSEARAYLRLALRHAERAGDIREIARIHNNLGVVLGLGGDLRGSTRSFEQAAQVLEEVGDRNNLAGVKVNIGVNYYKLGDFARALEHYEDTLTIAVAIGAPALESIGRSNLGELYRRLGRLRESLEQLEQSVELCRQTDDELGLAETYRQLAETNIALNRLDAAEEACTLAADSARAAGDPQAEAIVCRVRGLLEVTRGDYDRAMDEVQSSIRTFVDLGCTYELGQSLVLQAIILKHNGRLAAARTLIREAVALFQQAGAAAERDQAEHLLDSLALQTTEEFLS